MYLCHWLWLKWLLFFLSLPCYFGLGLPQCHQLKINWRKKRKFTAPNSSLFSFRFTVGPFTVSFHFKPCDWLGSILLCSFAFSMAFCQLDVLTLVVSLCKLFASVCSLRYWTNNNPFLSSKSPTVFISVTVFTIVACSFLFYIHPSVIFIVL